MFFGDTVGSSERRELGRAAERQSLWPQGGRGAGGRQRRAEESVHAYDPNGRRYEVGISEWEERIMVERREGRISAFGPSSGIGLVGVTNSLHGRRT